MRAFTLRLLPGDDLQAKLIDFVKRHKLSSGGKNWMVLEVGHVWGHVFLSTIPGYKQALGKRKWEKHYRNIRSFKNQPPLMLDVVEFNNTTLFSVHHHMRWLIDKGDNTNGKCECDQDIRRSL